MIPNRFTHPRTTQSFDAFRARTGACLLRLFSLIAALAMIGSPAQAHTGKGTIEIRSSDVTGPLTIRYVALITFDGDGHGAPDAVATIVAEAGTSVVGPVSLVPLPGGKGMYEGTITFPSAGTWQIRFSSLDPIAFLARTESVPESSPESTTPPAVTAVDATELTDESLVALEDRSRPADSRKDRGSTVAIVTGGAAALAVVAGVALLRRRNRRLVEK